MEPLVGRLPRALPARIVVCTNGSADVGEGGLREPSCVAAPETQEQRGAVRDAHAAFDRLSQSARGQGAGIDVFTAGLEPIASPVLQSLVEATGGLVVPQQSFAPHEFGKNLRKTLSEQSVPRCGAPPCTLEVSTSPNICITEIVGPVVGRDDDDSRKSNEKCATQKCVEVNRKDPRLAVTFFSRSYAQASSMVRISMLTFNLFLGHSKHTVKTCPVVLRHTVSLSHQTRITSWNLSMMTFSQ